MSNQIPNSGGPQQDPWSTSPSPWSGAPNHASGVPPLPGQPVPGPSAFSAPAYGQPPVFGAPARPPAPKDANPLTSLLDFGFTHYATPALVKVFYVLTFVLAAGGWLLWVLTLFSLGAVPTNPFNARSTVGPLPGLMGLFFGWIPAALTIVGTRFLLEFYLATIRTAEKMTALEARLAPPAAAHEANTQT